MGPKLKTSKPFRGKIMDGRSSISSYFSKAVPVPDPAPAPAPAPAPRRPIGEGLPDLGEHLRAGGEQPPPSAGNGTGAWKPWNSSAMSVEPAAEGERGELSTPPSSFYSMGILGAGDKGDGDVLTPERSRGKGKARAANDQPGKWARTTPPSPGFDVAHAPLEPHQTEVFDMTTAAMGDPTFASNRAKMGEIAREVAKAKGMGGDASIYDVLREACGEYGLHQLLALDQLRKRPLTDNEMEKGGIEVFDQGKDYAGQVNYVHAYEFWCKETTLAMVEAWESEMGIGSALCGSVRAKVNRHEWGDGALRLLISGEGLSASAHKYARGLQQPPTAVRARQPRQVNGRVANDGPAWNVPAGLVLVGGDAIDRVGTETYVWRRGDPHRSSRELHEAILALVFLGGLVWCPESVGLNQKVGGTFNDEQRARGANSCNVHGCSCTEAGAGCVCVRHVHVKNSSVGGAQSSAPGFGGRGKPFNSGVGATARDVSVEGAGDEYYGLHLGVPMKYLAAQLQSLVRPDGTLEESAPLCDEEVSPGYPGLTKSKGKFGLDRDGSLILGYHNGNKPNMCKKGGTIPVVTTRPPHRVPRFAIAPLLAGNIVSNKVYNDREMKLAKQKNQV